MLISYRQFKLNLKKIKPKKTLILTSILMVIIAFIWISKFAQKERKLILSLLPIYCQNYYILSG